MPRITHFQLFSAIFICTMVMPYQVLPKLLALIMQQNGWLGILLALAPGILLVAVYNYLIQNSEHNFPAMLEEHLGLVCGKLLGIVYIGVLLLAVVVGLVIFANFFLSNVLPGTPISILLIFMILPCYYALRTGLAATIRVVELVMLVGYPLSMVILLFGIGPDSNWSALLPIGNVSSSELIHGGLFALSYLGGMFVVLCLGPYIDDKQHVWKWLLGIVVLFVLSTSLATVIPIIDFGPYLTQAVTFPIFNIARSTNIGGFIRNIEIVLVSVVIPGVFGTVSLFWYVCCYTGQQVFGLKDYKILVGPTAMMAGFLAVLMVPNIHVLYIMLHQILPWIFNVFFVLLPLLLAGVVWFRKIWGRGRRVSKPSPA